MAKVKICGLRRECDAEYVNEAGPDYAGFIFAKGRRRYISPENARGLRKILAPDILSVGVFVNEDENVIAEAVRGTSDLIQLHGDESEGFISRIKKLTGLPVIKAFSVKSPEDMIRAENSSADFILLDNGIGGTGESFDLELIKNIKRPFFLAGGLSPENAGEIIKKYSPYALDVSSGVETDGYKDRDKIIKFMEQARTIKRKE